MYFLTANNDKYGLVDYDNNVVVPFEYDDISSVNDGTVYIIKINESPSEWAKQEVNSAIDAGIVPENIQKNYSHSVSRADVAEMFVALIEKSSGKNIDKFLKSKNASINNNAFNDTTDKNVLICNALGIINGVGNNKFDPKGTFTRAQIAAILNRIAKVMGIETDGYSHTFTDVSKHWVDSELGWSVHAGIINGVGNNKFDPDGILTTEQAIAITYRALNNLK